MPEQTPTPEVDMQPATPKADASAALLRDKRILPEGVVPKQAQGYVVAGLAVLILMAVMFSKNHSKPAAKETTTTSTTLSTDANQQKIHELEQDLSADQRQSQLQAQAQSQNGLPMQAGSPAAPGTQLPGAASSAQPLAPVTAQPAQPPRDPIADAEKALEFKARFASNLVSPMEAASHPSTEPVAANTDAAVHSAGLPQSPAAPSSSPADASANKRPPEVNLNRAHGQPYVLFEGTTIDTGLVTRLDGEFVGSVKVMVTNPVYSRDRQHVLIPEGTFILGDAQKVSGFGQKRLAVAFHRMIMPDGYNVDLDQFRGLDQAGETGLKDKVNNHYLEIFGASIALGIIAGAAEATTDSGYEENGSSMYRQGMAESLANSSANVLDKFINIPPTITIREGHRIKIYLTQDMLLPAYENHDMPGVM
jgi:type IV secretory pathway VirB10-like protein